MNLQIVDNTLPWSEYSVGEVLVIGSCGERFYTIREGQWVHVEDVPEEYYRMIDCIRYPNSDSIDHRELIQPGRIPDSIDEDEDVDNLIKEVQGLL